MIPEDKSALIVWRTMVPSVPFEEFQRLLTSQRRPEWNQAVGMIADAIRGSRPGRELCLQQAHEEYERELLAAEAVCLQAVMEGGWLKFSAIDNDPGAGKMATYSRFQASQVTREQSCPFYILNLQQLCYKTF